MIEADKMDFGLHWEENNTIPGLDDDLLYFICLIMITL